jgi:hypothetical protein
MSNKFLLLLSFALVLFVFACGEDEDPIIENEEELITSVTLTLFSNGQQEDVTIGFSDPDGDGGTAPSFSQTGVLQANSSYRGQLSFASPSGSIDAEIVDEGLDHQVFYVVSGGLPMTLTYNDTDSSGQPIGLMTNVATAAAGSGQLTITLRHQPVKASVSIDNPSAAGGSTDAEVTFNLAVE